jgi:hypothetical protein
MVDQPGSAGPVLQVSPLADAIVKVVAADYPTATVRRTGGHVRIDVPGGLTVPRAAVEQRLGRPVRFPEDLETVMLAFKGRLRLDDEQAVWTP